MILKGTIHERKEDSVWIVKYLMFSRVVKQQGIAVDTEFFELELPIQILPFDINAPFNASGIVSLIEGKKVEFEIIKGEPVPNGNNRIYPWGKTNDKAKLLPTNPYTSFVDMFNFGNPDIKITTTI